MSFTKSTRPSGLVIQNPETMFDPLPLGFSQVAVVPPGATTVYIAGQTGGQNKESFESQCRNAFDSIGRAMESAGGTIRDVAKLTVYIVDHDEAKHEALITVVSDVFEDWLPPTCTIVPLRESGTDERQLVEIEAVGIISSV